MTSRLGDLLALSSMFASLRLAAVVALTAATALPASAQDRPERADTVEFKIGRRVQIIRAPGTERQQRIEIRRGGDTTDVRLDVDPAMVDRWMRRILILDNDTTEAASTDSLGVPVRIRLRTRRAPHDGERTSDDRPSDLQRDIEIVQRDDDGTVRPGRPAGLWVERLSDDERPSGDVVIPRGDDVRVRRETQEETVRVIRDGDVLRIERHGEPTRTFPLRRAAGAQPDGTLVVLDGTGGTWIYLPPKAQK